MECRLYGNSKSLVDWKAFEETVKKFKYLFFNNKINKIISKNHRPWDLMNWIKKHKLPASEALQYNKRLYIDLNYL